MDNKLKGSIGLSRRAGMLVAGTEKAVKLVQSGKAGLLLLDENASANTQKLCGDKCRYHQVPLIVLENGSLGEAIGNDGVIAAAILRGSMAEHILNLIPEDKDPEK